MILKWTGLTLMCGASVYFGILSAREFKLHIDELKRIQSVVLRIQSGIHYHYRELDHILDSIGRNEPGIYGQWLCLISRKIQERKNERLSEIWRQATREMLGKKKSRLSETELIQIETIGEAFGQVDLRLQEEMIQRYLEELQENIHRQQLEIKGQQKIRRTLGITVGLFLVILFM